MSIPDRLWRVAKGHWTVAEERLRRAEAEASAYQELADALRRPAPPPPAALPPRPGGPAPAPPRLPPGEHDPLETSYAVLGVEPGAGLPEVEAAYEERLAAIRPERYAAGTNERALLEAQRSAVQAAYEKVRDALNPTETRFEKLEF
jgi:hypothetical protein